MYAALVLLVLSASPAEVSSAEDLPEPRWSAGGAPIVGYSSDVGLTVGAVGSLFHFADQQRPFQLSVNAHFLYSTGGVLEAGMGADFPSAFGSLNRLSLSVIYSRNAFNPFYGVSNAAVRDPALPSSFYSFDQRTPSAALFARRALRGSLSAFAGYRFELLTVIVRPDSLLAADGRFAMRDNRYAEAMAGLLEDTRDVEADPKNGHLIELSARASHPALGSQFATVFGFVDAAVYRTAFFSRLVFAARLAGEAGSGDIPLPVLADFGAYTIVQGLGGASTLRGYYLQQFIGPIKLISNLEARYRLIDTRLSGHPFAVSAVAFTDAGRVLGVPGPDAPGLLGLHADAGGGARVTWEEVFVLRFDAGFSPGQARFFVTLGQLF